MTRLKAGKLKVEEWTLEPGGKLLLEVSRVGRDTEADLKAFRADVAEKLVTLRAKPIDRRKSEVGSDCG
jgi:hypothetical protein